MSLLDKRLNNSVRKEIYLTWTIREHENYLFHVNKLSSLNKKYNNLLRYHDNSKEYNIKKNEISTKIEKTNSFIIYYRRKRNRYAENYLKLKRLNHK